MAVHSSILAWRIPCTEEPGGYSPWSHKETDMTEVTEHACMYKMNLHSQNKVNTDPFDANKIILLKPTLLILCSLHVTLLPPSLTPAHPTKLLSP